MEGSLSRCEPSTQKTHIVDGSIEYSRTFHANPPFHGRFSFDVRTLHAEDPYRGRFMPQKRTFHANPPFHGRFSFQVRTFHAEDPYRGRFMPQKRTFHARGRYHGRFASLKSAYYTWQRKCLRAKRCQSLTGNIQYSEKLNIRTGTYPRQKSSARRALRRAPRNA